MIFGRRRKREPEAEPDVDATVDGPDDIDDTADTPVEKADGEPDWDELDSREWRDQGPFDIDEVHIDDDEVQRLDLGSLVLTPIHGSQLRLQIDESTQKVISALVMVEDSALELMLFAAPRSGGQWPEMREGLIADAQSKGAQVGLAVGPFGTEVRRLMPAKTPDGEDAVQPSRVFAAEGPRWMLRGMLMGAAAMVNGEEGPAGALLDVFRDAVVRRGDEPMAPGEVIGMKLPESMTPQG
ncbi:DUF3710 domain-containing protein [Enemella sp. A6]|uniref:DUF3710 domain-containing protein n=1 Tax=Enemella sp. A6 TaxID=3440152 RepID=UPI003EB82E99